MKHDDQEPTMFDGEGRERSQFEQALVLYELRRYDLALPLFQAALTEQPDDARALAYLALCQAHTGKLREAARSAEQATATNPDLSFAHYVKAHVARNRHKMKDSLAGIQQALALDPSNSGYLGFAATLAADAKDFKKALKLAEQGLAVDPEDGFCMNVRAMALVRLGEPIAVVRETLLEELRRHPEDGMTLANMGYIELRDGNRQQALDMFSRSLAEDPENDYARAGLMEALRARYPLYGLMLRYFQWIGDKSEQAQYGLMALSYGIGRILDQLSRTNPRLRPWAKLLRTLMMWFSYLTWIAQPLGNLLLRANKYGRRLLNRDEENESSLVALCLLGAVGSWCLRQWTRKSVFALSNAVFLTLVIPVGSTYNARPGWRRHIMGAYSICLALIAFGGIYAYWQGPLSGKAVQLFEIYGGGLMLCQFLQVGLNKIPDRD